MVKENEVNLGTTIMAVAFDGGVVMGADSRTTMGFFVSNRVTNKITPLVDNRIFCCRSGSAADTQAIAEIVKVNANRLEGINGKPPSVAFVANLCKSICYEYRDSLCAGMIVAGWDSEASGSVYNISLGGSLQKKPLAISGSGSSYIYGFCDASFTPNMSRNDCVKFVVQAVSLAMSRDGYSGGVVRIAIIDENGVEKMVVSGDDLPFR